MRSRIPEVAEKGTPEPVPTPPPTPVPTPVPAPQPVAPAVAYPPGSVEAIIMAAAQAHGVDGNWMIRIASCESGLSPTSVGSGTYYGLFQFLPSTYAAHGGTNIFDPAEQSNIAAGMLANGGARSWPVCSQR